MSIVYLSGVAGNDPLDFFEHSSFSYRVRFALNIPDFANPASGSYDALNAYTWWQQAFVTSSTNAAFTGLFLADTNNDGAVDANQTIEIYRYNSQYVLFSERVDATAIQNDPAAIYDVQKALARYYYSNVVDGEFGQYAVSLITVTDMNGPTKSTIGANGHLFQDFAKSYYPSLSEDSLSSLLIDLASRDAALRYQSVINGNEITAANIAQYHYDAFENAGLSVKAWYGTFLEEFVATGSWASKVFHLADTSGDTAWMKAAADAVVNNFGADKS